MLFRRCMILREHATLACFQENVMASQKRVVVEARRNVSSKKRVSRSGVISRLFLWGFKRVCLVLAPFVFSAALVASLVGFAVAVELST